MPDKYDPDEKFKPDEDIEPEEALRRLVKNLGPGTFQLTSGDVYVTESPEDDDS